MQILTGQITCVMQTMFVHASSGGDTTTTTTYNDQQVLRWSWINAPAVPVTSTAQVFGVVWSAVGSGFKKFHQESVNHTQDGNDTWTVNSQSVVQLTARQKSASVIELSAPESSHPNGVRLETELFLDNVSQGPPRVTFGPAIALQVSIEWSPATVEDLLNRLDPISVGAPRQPRLLGVRTSRPGASLLRGSKRVELLPPVGPDAPLPQFPTTAHWSWEITTQR